MDVIIAGNGRKQIVFRHNEGELEMRGAPRVVRLYILTNRQLTRRMKVCAIQPSSTDLRHVVSVNMVPGALESPACRKFSMSN
jgi:hypothetical protein